MCVCVYIHVYVHVCVREAMGCSISFAVHCTTQADPQKEERRPFDRERDLQISRVVPAAKRQDIMKDSSHKLHSKFTHSSQQKYL